MRLNVHYVFGLTLLLGFGCATAQPLVAEGADASGIPTNFLSYAEANLQAVRKKYATEPTNSVVAWELGRACFDWGNLLNDPAAKEKIYNEGVAACRHSLRLNPKSAPAHYYLGMDVGRVADLKRNLAAFGMVKEVEKEFERARELDEDFCCGGPDRNLGLLYHNAPGWPLSVGNKKLARQHLERAVKLAPDFPENRLNLAEAYLQWHEQKLFQQEMAALEQLWPRAKTNLTGIAWEPDWADWEQRRAKLAEKLPSR